MFRFMFMYLLNGENHFGRVTEERDTEVDLCPIYVYNTYWTAEIVSEEIVRITNPRWMLLNSPL